VALITIGEGILLMALGLGGYFYTKAASRTALIPVILGAALVVLGILARRDNLRKHSMHTAMLLALIGFVGSGVMAVLGIVKQLRGVELPYPGAPYINLVIALCCVVFVVVGVKSFVDARRRRQQQAAS